MSLFRVDCPCSRRIHLSSSSLTAARPDRVRRTASSGASARCRESSPRFPGTPSHTASPALPTPHARPLWAATVGSLTMRTRGPPGPSGSALAPSSAPNGPTRQPGPPPARGSVRQIRTRVPGEPSTSQTTALLSAQSSSTAHCIRSDPGADHAMTRAFRSHLGEFCSMPVGATSTDPPRVLSSTAANPSGLSNAGRQQKSQPPPGLMRAADLPSARQKYCLTGQVRAPPLSAECSCFGVDVTEARLVPSGPPSQEGSAWSSAPSFATLVAQFRFDA